MVASTFFLISILASTAFSAPIAATDAASNTTQADASTLSVANATATSGNQTQLLQELEEAYLRVVADFQALPPIDFGPGPAIMPTADGDASAAKATAAEKRQLGLVLTGASVALPLVEDLIPQDVKTELEGDVSKLEDKLKSFFRRDLTVDDVILKRAISGSALLKAAGLISTIAPIAIKLIPSSIKTDIENDAKSLEDKLKSFFRRDIDASLSKRQAAIAGELAVDAVEDAPAIVKGAESLFSGANILKGVSIASTVGSVVDKIIPSSVKDTVENDAKSAWDSIKSWFRRDLQSEAAHRKLD